MTCTTCSNTNVTRRVAPKVVRSSKPRSTASLKAGLKAKPKGRVLKVPRIIPASGGCGCGRR